MWKPIRNTVYLCKKFHSHSFSPLKQTRHFAGKKTNKNEEINKKKKRSARGIIINA